MAADVGGALVPGGTGFGAAVRAGDKLRDSTKPSDKIFRRGKDKESAKRLDKLSKDAEARDFPHGVSGSTKDKFGDETVVATRKDLEDNGFEVIKTGKDPDHVTIRLPDPVTKEDAVKFNTCFGRLDCGK